MTQKQPGRDEKGRFLKGNTLAQKSGAYRYLKSGKLPQIRGKRQLKKELERIEEELKASVSDLNMKKSLLIHQAVKCHGFALLFELYCRSFGILDPQAAKRSILKFQPAFQTYLSLLNVQRSAIRDLNIDQTEAVKMLTPFQIVESEERQRRAKVRRGKRQKVKEQEANKQ